MSTLSSCSTIKTAGTNTQAANANVRLGIAFLNQGYTKNAKENLLRAQKQDPKNPAVWYAMGFFLENTGNRIEARKIYQHAIEVAPRNGAAHNNYGAFLCREGEYREAITQFLIGIKDPEYLEVGSTYENAGLCALKIPDKQLAMKYFQKALNENPRLIKSKIYLKNLVVTQH